MSLNFIFHLSDLHIRNGNDINSRFDEYKSVFDNTILSLNNIIKKNNLCFDDFIIIITGDIFHNRYNISNYGLLLYNHLILGLTNIGRLILFEGNHEYLIDNNPSLISSLNFNIPNLTVLNQSKSFIINDIGFSYLSLYDTMNSTKLTGRKELLPSFPLINETVKYKIALFHGAFASAKLFNGTEINNDEVHNPYPLEWIQDFDYVLLGDIHKRQLFTYKKNTICGYSGSLIQQNFGEDIIEHGYLLWNLNNKKIEEINVYNDIGYINIKQNINDDILIRKNGKYECLLQSEIENNLDYFPKKLEIKTFSKINFQNLNSLLKNYNINFTIISNLNEKCLNLDIITDYNIHNDLYNKDEVDNIINNNYILSYFSKLLSVDKYNKLTEIIKNKELLLFDVNKYPDDLTIECIKRNKDLSLIISSCIKNNDIKKIKQPFTIKYLEWEGLLCYENKNWLNMHELDTKTFMIKGKNGTGKSAIYDILLLAIWGENTKKSSLTSSIINYNKNNGYTIIDIELNGSLYRIQRDFIIKSDNSLKVCKSHSYLFKFINHNHLELLKKDNASNNQIKLLFGDIDNFLFSSMITQNIHNDILNLDAKKTLEVIDKSFNIEYIYNLYDLFKTAINKYKDFKKIIESKKEVFEKLISNSKIQIISESEIENLKSDLVLKTNENNKLLLLFDNINIDIKNSDNLIILETDYISLINSLDKTKIINDKNEFENLKLKYNELKFKLKDENDLLILKNAFNSIIENDLKNSNSIIKPCELSVLENEKKQLVQYLEKYNKNKDDINLFELEHTLSLLKNNELLLKHKEKELIENKPNKINKCLMNKNELLNEIIKIYNDINIFKEFISTLNILKSNNNIINSLNYNDYKLLLEQKLKLQKTIDLNKNKLLSFENDFNLIFKKQQNTIIKNKPLNQLKEINLKTSTAVNKQIKLININDILKQIENDNKIIEFHNNLYIQLENYNNELSLLTTNDEYKYDPKCKYCCKRPWVCKINELQLNIEKINKDLIDVEKLNSLIVTNEKNKIMKNNYDLLNEWYEYYKSKEQYDKITKELNKIIKDKDDLNKLIQSNNEEFIQINIDIENFNNYSYLLYEQLITIEQFEIYKSWETNYNEIIKNINDLKTEIKFLEEEINYNKNIKPRIDKYFELNDLYNKWFEYDYNTKIINANELFKIKEILDTTNKFIEYNTNNINKPLIKQKLDLNQIIKNNEKEIKSLNDKIIELTTINSYNNENKENYNKLFDIIIDLDNTIDILETIIINFQAFRIEMYDKFILNKLTEKTNKIIKSLCHKDTKPFKLDYIITIVKDIIHINWLINNENVSLHSSKETKQIISISQASGFQHFAISMALRMSLFMNKYEVQCNQLFIDEGFVNFDKYNLSIVPSFLKSLLSYFNSIIVVSHIDLIQDNIDEIIEIDYNKITSVSKMEYNNYKNIILK